MDWEILVTVIVAGTTNATVNVSEVIINLNQFSSSKVAYYMICYCYDYSSLPQSIAFLCLRFISNLSNTSSFSFYSAIDKTSYMDFLFKYFFVF